MKLSGDTAILTRLGGGTRSPAGVQYVAFI
jgi:hypothetical protein